MRRWMKGLICSVVGYATSATALPAGFVHLHDVDPSIAQEMRYAGDHNFVGHAITGYQQPVCILTQPAATALKQVQTALVKQGLSLKVYDCYRPTRAVDAFYQWSQDPKQYTMKQEFYPRTNKTALFTQGYIARYSGHSRGSTVDLTITPLHAEPSAPYQKGQALVACYAPYAQRYRDNSIDMGTGFDCLDVSAAGNDTDIPAIAQQHRLQLREVMMRHGFEPYSKEWWHFTLKNEPYPHQAFNFPVE